jgi:hypothetical protein
METSFSIVHSLFATTYTASAIVEAFVVNRLVV